MDATLCNSCNIAELTVTIVIHLPVVVLTATCIVCFRARC